jgi:hypothetical protein
VQLTSILRGVDSRMLLMTQGKLAPKGPSRGFLTSIMSAPPFIASKASSLSIGLMSSFRQIQLRFHSMMQNF